MWIIATLLLLRRLVLSCLDIGSFIGMRKVTLSVSRQTCFYFKGTCPGIKSSKNGYFILAY